MKIKTGSDIVAFIIAVILALVCIIIPFFSYNFLQINFLNLPTDAEL